MCCEHKPKDQETKKSLKFNKSLKPFCAFQEKKKKSLIH